MRGMKSDDMERNDAGKQKTLAFASHALKIENKIEYSNAKINRIDVRDEKTRDCTSIPKMALMHEVEKQGDMHHFTEERAISTVIALSSPVA